MGENLIFRCGGALGKRILSNDEWEEAFKNLRQLEQAMELDLKVDMQGMLQNKFEQVDDPHFEGPMEPNHAYLNGVRNFVTMEVVHEQVQVAFETVNVIQNEVLDGCNSSNDEDEPITIDGQPLKDRGNVDDGNNVNAFDSTI